MPDSAEALALFDTMFELAAKLGQLMAGGLAERGLTVSQAEVLFRLQGKGPMVQRELSQALQCTPRYITALVDQMEQAGLVARQPHPTDRRATLVALTTKGTKLANRIVTERTTSAQQVLGDLPPRQLNTANAVLRTFLDRLEAAAD